MVSTFIPDGNAPLQTPTQSWGSITPAASTAPGLCSPQCSSIYIDPRHLHLVRLGSPRLRKPGVDCPIFLADTQPLLPGAHLARLLPSEKTRAELNTDLGPPLPNTCQTPSSSHYGGWGGLASDTCSQGAQGSSCCTSSSSSSPRAGFGSVALNICPAWARPPASPNRRQSTTQAAGEEAPSPTSPPPWPLAPSSTTSG